MSVDLSVISFPEPVADSRHRQHYLDSYPKQWGGFFTNLHYDSPVHSICNGIREGIKKGRTIAVISGHPEYCREKILSWLDLHVLKGHTWELYLRPDEEFIDSIELRERIFEQLVERHGTFNLIAVHEQFKKDADWWLKLEPEFVKHYEKVTK